MGPPQGAGFGCYPSQMEMPEIPATAKRGILSWRRLTLYVLTAAGVVMCLVFSRTLLFSITGALTLGVVLDVPRKALRRRFGSATTAGVLIAAVLVVVVLPGFFMFRSLIREAIHVVRWVQNGHAALALQNFSMRHEKMGGLLQRVLDQLTPDDSGRELASTVAGWVGLGLRNLAVGIAHAVLMLFLLFFVLRDRDAALETLASLVPLPERKTNDFLSKLGEVTHAIFLGRFVVAGVQGTLAGLAYWALGVDGALLWGVCTGLLGLIPAFGAFMVWLPIALYLGFSGSWVKAGILAVWGGVLISMIDNILYPVLVGQRADLHTAVIFVAIFGGLAVFGFSGFVLGPVIVAATILLLREWKSA